MSEYDDFEKFARDLFLFTSRVPMDVRDIEDRRFLLTDFMKKAVDVALMFGYLHCDKIRRLLRRSFKKGRFKEFRTDEEFMRFTIPKCLIDAKMYFFSLMMVAVFILELTSTLYEKKGCFRFIHTGYKCFAAVFNRRFKLRFEANGGFKGLYKYFRFAKSINGMDRMNEDY